MKTGDKIKFSRYEWRVLDIQENAALIITEEVIERRPYHNILMDITWADCDMRKYLNGEFYDKFTENEKSRIITVTNKPCQRLSRIFSLFKCQRPDEMIFNYLVALSASMSD